MYYVYADDNSIYNPLDSSLTIHSPKVTLEIGKAGSFQFDIPPTNQYYSSLTQLKTIIRVELDDKVIFYGRVFSITRNFNNIKHVYCEGALSYLIDTLQKAKSFKGKAKTLFNKIMATHNDMTTGDKKFTIDRLEIEDTDVIIPGKKDDDGKYYGSKYEQTIIESIAEEWLTTYDYINNVLIDYLGGYLMYEYDQNAVQESKKNKISYVSESSFDSLIEQYSSGDLSAPEIEYGVNLLDLTEEMNAEDLFTVLIPLGDDNLTIAKATNTSGHSDIEIVKINDKSIGIADKESLEKYGKIIKSYVFNDVNSANTLFTDGYKYLKAHKNLPISFTIKAVDMHFVDGIQEIIDIGQIVKINSTPHNLVQYLICTKIEYDLEDASKNQYTFGNPKQSLTERYKKNKDKQKRGSSRGASKSSGAALATASYVAQTYAEAVSKNFADIKTWVEDHYAGIEQSVRFISNNGEGIAKATLWVDEHSANAQEVIAWYGKHAYSAVNTIKWANDYGAGIEEAITWKNKWASSTVDTIKWANDYSAGIREAINWYSRYAISAVNTIKWADDNSAGIKQTINWYNKNSGGVAEATRWVGKYGAGANEVIDWHDAHSAGVVKAENWVNSNGAGALKVIGWYNAHAAGAIKAEQWVNASGARADKVISWYNAHAAGAIKAVNWVNSNGATATKVLEWYNKHAGGFIKSEEWVRANEAKVTKVVNWNNQYAAGAISSTKWINENGGGAKEAIKWYNNNARATVETNKWVNENKASFETIAKWKGKYAEKWVNSIAGVKATAESAKAMASLFATYNGKTAAINLTANNATTMIQLIAKYVDASEVEKFVLKGFSAQGGKVIIGSAAMTLNTNFIQTGTSSYSLIQNLYVGTGKVDDNKVLSRRQIKNLIVGSSWSVSNLTTASQIVSQSYILNTIENGNLDTGTGTFTAYNGKLSVGSSGTILKGNLIQNQGSDYSIIRELYTGSLKTDNNRVLSRQQTKDLIPDTVSQSYILSKIKGTSIAFDAVDCEGLKVRRSGKLMSLSDYIKDIVDSNYINGRLTSSKIVSLIKGKDVDFNSVKIKGTGILYYINKNHKHLVKSLNEYTGNGVG